MGKRIGLLTGEGDAPGLNFCLKTIVHNAIDRGYEVVGLRKGWHGLIYYDPDEPVTHADNAMIMTKPKVRTIDQLAGSYLHSSRIDPGHCHSQEAPPFLRVNADDDQPLDLTNHIKRAIDHLQIDALIVLGAGTSLKYSARLSQEGIPVIGIPKSVHNDISGTTYSLGFSSALRRGVGFVNEVRDIAASREEIAVIAVLGHDSGLATMLIASFANADRTLIPEVPFNPGRLAELLIEDKRRNPSNYAILVMSDGSRLDPTAAPEEIAKLSADVVAAGQRGSGAMTTRVLEDFIGEHILYQPLSYLTRTGDADGWDLIAATNFGIMAVDLIANNKTGRLVSYRLEDGYIDVPLEEVIHPASVDMADFYDPSQYAPKSTIFTVAARRTLGV
ncbi:MAG: 6-phosphofructokinase [Anaerolineae bacterium]|nr:6-phosphofructokinase [Anaerolineae bacterium]MCB0225192.1 6-phosphofructokinase [Anaerolineae bacterium]